MMNPGSEGKKKCFFCGRKCFALFGIILFIQLPVMYYLYKVEVNFDLSFVGKSTSATQEDNQINPNITKELPNRTFASNSTDKNSSTVSPQKEITQKTSTSLPKCQNPPPRLVGALAVNFDHEALSFEEIKKHNIDVKIGGRYAPPNCVPPSRVAIIIPFRNRDEHLKYFLEYMHPIFRRQLIEYQIFIINQAIPDKFNRAMLLNVGFKEALRENPNFDCFAFHDIDLVIQNDKNLYYCSDQPRHLSVAVDKFNYALPYTAIFGGATLIRKDQFELVNGHANRFWGWGGEDDDMYNRIRAKNLKIIRYSKEIARYKMIKHKREKGNEPNPQRFQMINISKQKMLTDGLNSLKYKVLSSEHNDLYTNITVALEK